MSESRFTANDCPETINLRVAGTDSFFLPRPYREEIASCFNAKLESWLGPQIFWTNTAIGAWREMGRTKLDESTHTARLFGVQEIVKKECEHWGYFYLHETAEYKCSKCGVSLKPNWTQVK